MTSPGEERWKGKYESPAWKVEIAKGYVPYHKLTIDDFHVDDKDHPQSGMYTRGFFHYYYYAHWSSLRGEFTAKVTTWEVRSGLDRNLTTRRSWFRRTTQFMPHEQGHLDINELYSTKLASITLDQLPIGKGKSGDDALADLRDKLKQLCDDTSRESQLEQDLYDKETKGGENTAQQKAWNEALAKRLRELHVVYAERL